MKKTSAADSRPTSRPEEAKLSTSAAATASPATRWDKGTEVGPNLSMIAAKYNSAVIKEAVVNPSSAIVFGYELTTAKTKDGILHSGFIISDGDPLILKNSGGRNIEVARSKITELQTSKKSLMPSAQMLNLSNEDLDAISLFLREAAEQTK